MQAHKTSNPNKKRIIYSVVVVLIITLTLLSGSFMSRVENPVYTVVKSENKFELRQYPQLIVAEVEVVGEREKAIKTGFKILADYIFGNNKAKQSIAMTAPVTQAENQKIAMTAPVMQKSTKENLWQIRFVMPAQYSLENLPTPNDKRVQLHTINKFSTVSIRFSGLASESNLAHQLQNLEEYVVKNKLKTAGAPVYAFYNPPWTLPFLRRNEIWIEVKP